MNAPTLYGLVLAGGRSTRMGRDKGLINYHGKPQREFVRDLLAPFCEQVHISLRPDQAAHASLPNVIEDSQQNAGPAAGLLAAHHQFPEVAWLVIGCDYPLLQAEDIEQLIMQRDAGVLSTAFLNTERNWPEPLLAIWEPRGLALLAESVKNGQLSPRKLLQENGVHGIAPHHPERLHSVDDEAALKALKVRLNDS